MPTVAVLQWPLPSARRCAPCLRDFRQWAFLVKTGNWMNHLQYDWESPIWRHVFRGLSRGHTLVRYDARGNGLSDWNVDMVSLDAWVTDLETVVDAVGVERFPLLGISQGGTVAVAYAVRRPERVSHLILYGAFALGGKRRAPAEKEMWEAMTTLIASGGARIIQAFGKCSPRDSSRTERMSSQSISTSCN
jgi:pimeloyl-ACP methyl ester carboxylesterase